MNNFYSQNIEDIGLFTFYKQQAELEQKWQTQQRERHKKMISHKKKLKTQSKDKQKSKQKKKIKIKKDSQNILINLTNKKNINQQKIIKQLSIKSPYITHHINYNQKTKKYIKQLQQTRKIKFAQYKQNYNQLNKNNHQFLSTVNHNLQPFNNIQLNTTTQQQSNLKNKRSQSVNDTRHVVPKLNQQLQPLYLLQNLKIPASAENLKMKSYFSFLSQKKAQKAPHRSNNSLNKLPKISIQTPTVQKLNPPPFIKKNFPSNYYNYLDILINNKKFKLKNIYQSQKFHSQTFINLLNNKSNQNHHSVLFRTNRNTK